MVLMGNRVRCRLLIPHSEIGVWCFHQVLSFTAFMSDDDDDTNIINRQLFGHSSKLVENIESEEKRVDKVNT